MSQAESELFLQKMHTLIRSGQRDFVRRTRDGKTYLQQLLELRITSIDAAWDLVLELNSSHYFKGPVIDHRDGPGSPLDVWVFKMEINGDTAYIKLKDETAQRGCVCISFHRDEP